MAIEITGYLMLEREDAKSLSPNRVIEHIISLDEGHDRPVWQWVKSPAAGKKSAWVPENPETILLDGLLMLICDGLQNPFLKAQIDPLRGGSNSLVDLNVNRLEIDNGSELKNLLQGNRICVVAYPDSSLLGLSEKLSRAGVGHRLLK